MEDIQFIQSLVNKYGPNQRLQIVLDNEVGKYERMMYLEAFRTDAEEMSTATIERVAADRNTPLDILHIAKQEIVNRPRRLAIQSAILERASKGVPKQAPLDLEGKLVSNTPEFKEKQHVILEVEETREESDIITWLNALNALDERLVKFDKIMIGITLGRVLVTWKKPLRPYIASVRFSRQDTMSSLYHFKCLADKTLSSVRPFLVDGIMQNFRRLADQCSLQDMITLNRIHSMCKTGDTDIAHIVWTRMEGLCGAHPDILEFMGGIAADLNTNT